MEEQHELYNELQELHEKFDANPEDEEVRAALEIQEEKYAAKGDYTLFAEEGPEKQSKLLEAMDFTDQITPDMKLYNAYLSLSEV